MCNEYFRTGGFLVKQNIVSLLANAIDPECDKKKEKERKKKSRPVRSM
jgi:hypothetical protein